MGLKRCPSFSKRPDFPCGLRVLLVDIDSAARDDAELLLKDCNYSVTTCSTTAEALARLSCGANGYDVVLADKSAIAGKARDKQRLLDSTTGLPCILMAQDPSPADIMAGIELGAVDFLEKPLSPLKLRNIWQHTVRSMMSNMNINCTATLDTAALAAASASAATLAAVKKELDEMEVIMQEAEEMVKPTPPLSMGAGKTGNVALATASSLYESTRCLSRSGSTAAADSFAPPAATAPTASSAPGSPCKDSAEQQKKHSLVHSCPSTRSLSSVNSMSSCYSNLLLAVPSPPGSPSNSGLEGNATEAAAANTNIMSGTPAASTTGSPKSAALQPAQQQRCIKKAVRHPTPATPASKPPLAVVKPQQSNQANIGPSCGATTAGPLPMNPGLTSVPLPTGLGPLPQGMVWGMPMCPLARAPGIVPPSNSNSAAASNHQQQTGVPMPTLSGPGMPWGMCGVPPMGMPIGMAGMPPPPFMPGFAMMPHMAMTVAPFAPFASGMMTAGSMGAFTATGAAVDPATAAAAVQSVAGQVVSGTLQVDPAAAAAAPVPASVIAGHQATAAATPAATGAAAAAALDASLGEFTPVADAPVNDAAVTAMDVGVDFDFMLGDITAEDDLDVGMSGLLDGELTALEKDGLRLPAELQELKALEVEACQQPRASFDCHGSRPARVSFDCSTASTATTGRVSFDCSVSNAVVGSRGNCRTHSSQRVSFEVGSTTRAQSAHPLDASFNQAALAAAGAFNESAAAKGLTSAKSAPADLLGSMSDLLAACSDTSSQGSAGMTHVDSYGMLADLQSLFGPTGDVTGEDNGCNAPAASLFDDVMDDLPLELAMHKSCSLADLISAGFPGISA